MASADPMTNTIYVTNGPADTVAVINGNKNTVTATIPVGFEPRGAAADRITNRVYVANSGGNTVSVIASCLR
jgi:YVTN family beta-propeller protein